MSGGAGLWRDGGGQWPSRWVPRVLVLPRLPEPSAARRQATEQMIEVNREFIEQCRAGSDCNTGASI